ncbi:MAG: chloride channel protein [Prevotellaceae bacterium]|jgi:CIC family chloride channel protein|nr:chloride channel protein [Prevotellaceae bacterium]
MKAPNDWYLKMIGWRERNIKEKNFVLVLALLVGFFTALAAFALKSAIDLIHELLKKGIDINGANILYLIYPSVGILIASLFVRYVVKDDISHGVTKILYAISQRKNRIKPHNIWSSLAASSITIGFGGSVGAEAPMVLTGSAIGSNLGSFFKVNQKTMQLLLGCGAAGALAGIFKAPIAGVFFTLEVLMLDMTMASLIPLTICSVTATSVAYFLMGDAPFFNFAITEPFSITRIPAIILLGLVCGFVSLYFTRGMNWIEDIFRKLNMPYKKLILGGIILSLLIFLFPSLYGEGYDTINLLLGGNGKEVMDGSIFYTGASREEFLILYLVLVLLFKIFASAATNGAGGTGGIFAPSLFMGCLTGFLLGHVLNLLGFNVPEANFALAGMAGVMAGVMHSPLTAIFLIAELTGGYSLFMNLMITATISYLTIIMFEPHSLYAMRLAKRGELLTHHKDKAVLTLLKMESVIETDLKTVSPDMMLGELVKVVSQSRRNIFPVVDKNGKLLGIVLLDEIRNIMFRSELYQRFRVRKLMISPPAKVNIEMPMEKVMDLFESTNAWNLPVIDENEKYLGFVSKSKIFNSYRNVLVHFSDE